MVQVKKKTWFVSLTVLVLLAIGVSIFLYSYYNSYKRKAVISSLELKRQTTIEWHNMVINLPPNLYFKYRHDGEEIMIVDPDNVEGGSTLHLRGVELSNLTGGYLLDRVRQSDNTILSSGNMDFKGRKAFHIEQHDLRNKMYIRRI